MAFFNATWATQTEVHVGILHEAIVLLHKITLKWQTELFLAWH